MLSATCQSRPGQLRCPQARPRTSRHQGRIVKWCPSQWIYKVSASTLCWQKSGCANDENIHTQKCLEIHAFPLNSTKDFGTGNSQVRPSALFRHILNVIAACSVIHVTASHSQWSFLGCHPAALRAAGAWESFNALPAVTYSVSWSFATIRTVSRECKNGCARKGHREVPAKLGDHPIMIFRCSPPIMTPCHRDQRWDIPRRTPCIRNEMVRAWSPAIRFYLQWAAQDLGRVFLLDSLPHHFVRGAGVQTARARALSLVTTGVSSSGAVSISASHSGAMSGPTCTFQSTCKRVRASRVAWIYPCARHCWLPHHLASRRWRCVQRPSSLQRWATTCELQRRENGFPYHQSVRLRQGPLWRCLCETWLHSLARAYFESTC